MLKIEIPYISYHISEYAMKRASQRMSKYNKDPSYKCKSCIFFANRNDTYLIHLHRHHDSDPFYCKSCGYTCLQRKEIKRHNKTHRASDAPGMPKPRKPATVVHDSGWITSDLIRSITGTPSSPQTFQTLHDITTEASSLIEQAKKLNLDVDLYKRIQNIAKHINKCTCKVCKT
jgi:Pyruvate/2-oxoacid:ferredoxin oxidoreductase delta subunit